MSQYKILYAEDDETLAFLTTDNLEQSGYEVLHCKDGSECLQAFHDNDIDICILDIMMPGKDGFAVAEEIRRHNIDVPIIFLSAKTLKEDRIKGLRLGADDYLIKPFSIEELLLKINIFLARAQKRTSRTAATYTVGRFNFDAQNYILDDSHKKITLTQREAELLRLFIENANSVLKREDILKTLWGNDDYFMGRSLDVFISRLRKILTDEKDISIENLHGIGFRFNTPR